MDKYERLSNFCFKCGKLGHSLSFCSHPQPYTQGDLRIAYGNWMKVMQNIGESIVETHVHDTPVVQRILVPTIDVDELRTLLSKSLTLDNPSHPIPKLESPKTLCTKVNKTPLQDISNYNTTLFPKIPLITLGNPNNKVVSLTRTSIIDLETLENSNSLNKFDRNFDLNYTKATYSPSLRITSSPALS